MTESAASAGSSLAGTVGKWAAALVAVVGVAQAATTWIGGYWKAQQETRLAEIKDRSALASDYLRMIVAKDIANADRIFLLDALSAIDQHPLQKWAQQKSAQYKAAEASKNKALQALQEAKRMREGAERKEAELQAQIEGLNADIQRNPDDELQRETLRKQIIVKLEELSQVQGSIAAADVRVKDANVIESEAKQGLVPRPGAGLGDAISRIAEKVNVERIKQFFPTAEARDLDEALPLLRAALQEFQITDPKMAAAIVATIKISAPKFKVGEVSGPSNDKYRGRGYILLTGKDNYERMGKILRLGDTLVAFPETMKQPEVAARSLVALFVDRNVGDALGTDDLALVRRKLTGRSENLAEFTDAYRKILTYFNS